MATLPTYYVKLADGSSLTLKNVTDTPTLVSPAAIDDAYYRDSAQVLEGLGLIPAFLVETDISAGSATTIEATPTDAQNSFPDEMSHVPPRQLNFKLSYWEFLIAPDPLDVLTTYGYYIRWDRLDGMATEPISSF